MWRHIRDTALKTILYSILIALVLKVGWDYPIGLTILALLCINSCLLTALWYSEKVERPILWHMMIVLFIGIASTCLLEGESLHNSNEWRPISLLILIACGLTTVVERKILKEQFNKRIDLWLPPLSLFTVAVLGLLILEGRQNQIVRRLSILTIVTTLILVTFNKCNRRSNTKIAYEIDERGYVKSLISFSALALGIMLLLPVANVLPGTAWVKKQVATWQWRFGRVELDSETKLIRNPPQSNAVVCTVISDRPVYLRRRAYTTYEEGVWKVEDVSPHVWNPLDGGSIYREYTLLRMLLQKIEMGVVEIESFEEKYESILKLPMSTVSMHFVKIAENESPTSYFTINGLSSIELEEGGEVGYIDSLDNLYFTSFDQEMQSQYRINYREYELKEGSRELALLRQITPGELIRVWANAYPQSYEIGNNIFERARSNWGDDNYIEKYLQVPDTVQAQIESYAEELVEGQTGQLAQAEAICNALKYGGAYTYKLGARYEDASRDPIVDFLLYGKEGICQDFASSMVLLCRSIGLPARYVTGYYATEEGKIEGEYIVREKDAHAFVEVYITGYGWMSFDPTTAIEEGTIGTNIISIALGDFSMKISDLLLVIARISLLILVGRKPASILMRNLWLRWLLHKAPEKAIEILMNKTLQVLEERDIERKEDETLSSLTLRLREEGLEIGEITSVFEAYYYGKQIPESEKLRLACKCYDHLFKEKTYKQKKKIEKINC